MYKAYQAVTNLIMAIFEFICYTASLIIPFSLCIQVICRYFLHRPISGIEELAVCSFTLLILAGSAIMFKSRQYIIVDVFFNAFPIKYKRIVDAVCQLLMIAIFALLIYSGALALPAQKAFHSVVLKIPRGLYTIGFMISCGFMLSCCIEQFCMIVSGNNGTEVIADRQ